jgi:aryl-alcohol dehydrogenase-like predicted oxidoreductase
MTAGMNYREIGRSGIRISEIGLGCWTIGGPGVSEDGYPNGWSAVDDAEAVRAIEWALDAGVNHFDTADVYGNGKAERLLGTALGSRSHSSIVAGKVGYIRNGADHPYEPSNIRRQCERSLKNLKRGHLDIYYFHHGDFGPGDCRLDRAVEQMERLREQGKIRCIGLSAYAERDFARLVPKIRPSSVQSWANMMDCHFIAPRSGLMRLCEKYGVSFVAFSPLDQGILLGKYRNAAAPEFGEGDHRSRSEKFRPRYLARANDGIEKVSARFGGTAENLARVALQFILYHKHVAGVMPGFRNLEQVRMNISASGRPLNGEEIAFVRKAFHRSRV